MNAEPFIAFKTNTSGKNKRAPEIWKRMYDYFLTNKIQFLRIITRGQT
jgi:hypothetical protein